MNQDKHTEEGEQSKQKHAVTLWHDVRKKKPRKLSHSGGFQIQQQSQKETFTSKRPENKLQADEVRNVWISYISFMLIHAFSMFSDMTLHRCQQYWNRRLDQIRDKSQ